MEDISGIISINKPSGVSSFWAVKQVKRVLGVKKAGHCGTLDPLAEGVLLVLFGKATKLQERFMGCRKAYRAVFKLGVSTDTGDMTGKVLSSQPPTDFDENKLGEVVRSFAGDIYQVPPMYSALKYGGKRLYELARQGKEVRREPRRVTIHSIELLSGSKDRFEIRVECSKGTYIRTLGEDIGAKLGCGAALEALCREKSGEFSVANSFDGRLLQHIGRDELLKHATIT